MVNGCGSLQSEHNVVQSTCGTTTLQTDAQSSLD